MSMGLLCTQDLHAEVPPCLPSFIAGQARVEASVPLLNLGHPQHPATWKRGHGLQPGSEQPLPAHQEEGSTKHYN
jgi:hypothetical protein